ncbi:MAG: hypothetical protein MUO60_16795, partial [Clostridiaceae bacterium]|nr:hypothetical protein [Clostridiaceae bacterium]
MALQFYAMAGIDATTIPLFMKVAIVLVVSTMLYFIPIPDNFKAISFPVILSLVFAATVIEKNNPMVHYLVFISIAMITLYFRKKLI